MEEHRLSREMDLSSTSINTHAHVSRIFWRTSSYFGKEIGHWSCPIVKLTYPRNGVTSTRRYPLNTDLFNVEAEIRDITYAYVCIYIYISGGWWKNRFPSLNGKYTSRPFVEHNVEGGKGLTIVQYFPSTNCTRSSRYKVCLIGKHCSVDACGLPASRGRSRHRGREGEKGERERGEAGNRFNPSVALDCGIGSAKTNNLTISRHPADIQPLPIP